VYGLQILLNIKIYRSVLFLSFKEKLKDKIYFYGLMLEFIVVVNDKF